MLEYSKLFIGGKWVSPSNDRRIDVRSPSEFAEDHIPGAVNLPVLVF